MHFKKYKKIQNVLLSNFVLKVFHFKCINYICILNVYKKKSKKS